MMNGGVSIQPPKGKHNYKLFNFLGRFLRRNC